MAGLSETLDLDVSAALRQINTIEAALGSAAMSFRVDLANALDVLRSTSATVNVDADTSSVAGEVTAAVDAADASVTATADAGDVTGSITAAVDAADSDVLVNGDAGDVTTSIDQAIAAADDEVRLHAETSDITREVDQALGATDLSLVLDVDFADAIKAGRAVDDIGTEAKGATKAIKETADSTKTLGDRIGNAKQLALGLGAAFTLRAAIQQVQGAIDAASDLAESTSKVSVVFGDSANVIETWANTSATSMGLSKQAALEAAGTFGNLFTALGQTQAEATKLSPEVVQLAADLASFNNLETADVLEKLRSGLVGEVEPLRSLGVSFLDAQVQAKGTELGLRGVNGELSESAKVQARYALIMEQTTSAQGDFARTADGLANSERTATAELKNAQAEVGQRLLPIMLKAVHGVEDFVSAFLSLPEPLQNAILLTAGFTAVAAPLVGVGALVVDAVQGIGTAMTFLAASSSVGLVALSGFGIALAGLAAAYVLLSSVRSAFAKAEAQLDASNASSVNNQALLAAGVRKTSDELRDQAVADYMAGAASRGFSSDTKDVTEASKVMQDQIRKAKPVLNELAESSGVSKERIAELATEMGINLGAASNKQKDALAQAIGTISGAVTPTERLSAVTETLGDQFATTKEQVDAFDEALDAALGVFLTADQAAISLREKVRDLAAEMAAGKEPAESLAAYHDRLASSTIDVVRAAEDEVSALTRAGKISTDSASQTGALRDRLAVLAEQFPELRDQINGYIDRLNAIPSPEVKVTADVQQFLDSLAGAETTAGASGARTGAAYGQGFAQGVFTAQDAANAAAINMAQDADANARAALQVDSPSKVGMELGAFYVQGVAEGITGNALDSLADAAQDIGSSASKATAEALDKAASEVRSGSGRKMATTGYDVGGFLVEGLALGIEGEQEHANNAALAFFTGLTDVVSAAEAITQEESLGILTAMQEVSAAEEALAEVRKDRGASALDVRVAELELAAAQQEVNDATLDAIDATQAVTDALEEQRKEAERLNDALDSTLSALNAVSGVAGAKNELQNAKDELADAKERAAELPDEIAEAEKRLAAARKDAARVTASEELAILRADNNVQTAQEELEAAQASGTATADELREKQLEVTVAQEALTAAQEDSVAPTNEVTDAERELQDLRDEQATALDDIKTATDNVQDAQLGLVDAERQLMEAGQNLSGTDDEVTAYFTGIAKAAGLTTEEINDLIDAMNDAREAAGKKATTSSDAVADYLEAYYQEEQQALADYLEAYYQAHKDDPVASTSNSTSNVSNVTVNIEATVADATTASTLLAEAEFKATAGRFG